MKIDSTNNPQRLAAGELRDIKKTAGPQPNSAPATSARFQPSNAQDTSQDIDTARVNEIRQAISEGRLDIRADKIADAIIASARELIADR